MDGLGEVVKSKNETAKSQELEIKLAEYGIQIAAVKEDTERIINRLDEINGRVGRTESKLAFLQGMSFFMFASLGVIFGILGIYR